MKSKSLYLLYFVLILFECSSPSLAQDKFNVYYLSIGSADYLQDFTLYEEGFNGFNRVPSANLSAEQMGLLFDSFGARGSTVVSAPANYITKAKVFDAIKELIKIAEDDPSPLLVFYFCGHGLSEGYGWNQFLIPGDFNENLENSDLVELGEQGIHVGDVYDALEASGLPFLMLLDCCYEGNEENIDVNDYAYQESLRKIAVLLEDGMSIVRRMNEFHEPNPVIFSTTPGTLAEVVPFSFNGKEEKVGPLCRRSLLAFQENQSVTLAEFIGLLTSPDLDNHTEPSITNWVSTSAGVYQIK